MPMRWTPENDQLLLLKILETHDIRLDPKKVAEVWPTIEDQDKPTPRAITERLVRMRAMIKPGNSNSSFMIGSGPGSSSGSPASKRGRKPGSSNTTPRSAQRKKAADDSGNGKNALTQGSPLKSEKMDLDDDNATNSADAEHELDTDFVAGEADNTNIETPSKKRKGRGLFDIPGPTAAPSTPAPTPAAAGIMSSRTHELSGVQVGSSLGLNSQKRAQQLLNAVSDGSPVKRIPRARQAATKFSIVNYTNHLGDDEDGFEPGMDEVDSSASDYVPDSAVFDDDHFA
ncbi:hypothetical protein BDW66DRAFT_120390 [Aspergillus desertorum]